jgi:hypothetical protein
LSFFENDEKRRIFLLNSYLILIKSEQFQMDMEIQLSPDFPEFNIDKSHCLKQINIVTEYYIIITPEINSDFHQ